MKFVKISLLSLFLFTPFVTSAQEAWFDWQVIYADKFNIFYHRDDSLNAVAISEILTDEYPSISAELGADVEAPIGIFIAPSKYRFNVLTGGALPHWGEAVADPGKQIIIVKSPRWTNSTGNQRVVVIHELVHILVGTAAGEAAVPRWLNEGLAIYFSGETSYFGGSELSHAQLSEQIIPLRQIDGVLNFGQSQANLAYQESYLAVVYLIDAYGRSAIPILLQSLREKQNINTALQDAFGVTFVQFEQEWRQYLLEKYKWSFLIEFDKYLWLFIFLLFVLAIVAMVIRKRRTLAKWQAESLDSSPTSEI
jgi:hypothetical protein